MANATPGKIVDKDIVKIRDKSYCVLSFHPSN